VEEKDYSNSIVSHARWTPYDDHIKCPPTSFQDFRNLETPEQMDKLLNNGVTKPVLFDLQNSWLKGEQYAHIL
jgi:hypothetical protein